MKRKHILMIGIALSFAGVWAVNLVAEEGARHWTPLFNGKNLSGWTNAAGEPAEPGSWAIEEGGVLHRKDKGGDLYSAKEYGDFELEFEWKVSEGANSGVKYRVAKYGEKGKLIGAEFQVLDDDGHPNGKKATTRAGCLYDVAAVDEAKKKLKPVGEWNTSRIVAKGGKLEHYVNGEKILEIDAASPDWKTMIDGGKFSGIYDFATKKGRFLIQDHGDEVWFRGFRVREL